MTGTEATQPTLLIVDDMSTNLFAVEAAMLDLPIAFLTAANGEEALQRLDESPVRPFMAVVDVRMPRMDGYHLARLLRQHDKGRAMPILLVSSGPAEEGALEDLHLDGVDFMLKPFDMDMLQDKARLALDAWLKSGEESRRNAE